MKKQNFLKGSVILMLSAAIAKILGAFFKIPLTNMLGGVGMSYFSSAYSLFMPVYALSVTGLSSAVARMTAQNIALGMYENAKRVRRTALTVFSAAGLSGSLLILLLAKPFSVHSAGNPEAWLAVAMISPAVFFGCITAVERGYYEGLSNMYPTALSQAAEGTVKVVAGLWLCGYVKANSEKIMPYFPDITDVRAISAAAGILGVTLSSLGAVIFFAFMRIFSGKTEKGEKILVSRRKIAKELVLTALPVGISSVVTNLTALIDMWTVIGCISYFRGLKPVLGISAEDMPQFVYGSFSGIALTVFNLVPSVTNMLGKGILPCITEAWENHNNTALEKSTIQALITSAILSVPAAFGLGVLSEQVLIFLFPKQSDEVEICINSLRLLMPGMVCLCVAFPVFSMLQAVGKASAPLKIMLFGTAVKLTGNLVLIPLTGVDGAAISTSLCYAVILAVSLIVYIRTSGIKINPAPFISIAYSGIMCGAAAYLAVNIPSLHGISAIGQIIISAVSGGTVYFISLFLCDSKKNPLKSLILSNA